MMNLRHGLATSLLALLFWGLPTPGTHAAESPMDKTPVAGTRTFTLMVKDLKRGYSVHIPRSYDGAQKWPVVVMFHGGGGTARAAVRETGWNDKADAEGFLAVYPEGTSPDPTRRSRFRDNPQTWNDGSRRSNVGAARRQVPDILFVSAMLADLNKHFSVDERRVFVTGFSNGASMAFRVARELSEDIAAVAPVAGADWLMDTHPTHPVPLMYITGTADPLNPIEGGQIRIGRKALGEKPSTEEMIKKWRKIHECPDTGFVIHDQDGTMGMAYGFPGEAAPVVLYTIEGHGHHWPGGKSALPVKLVGKNTARLKATDVIWEFFETHPRSMKEGGPQGSSADPDRSFR